MDFEVDIVYGVEMGCFVLLVMVVCGIVVDDIVYF